MLKSRTKRKIKAAIPAKQAIIEAASQQASSIFLQDMRYFFNN